MCSYAACAGRIPGYESAGTFFWGRGGEFPIAAKGSGIVGGYIGVILGLYGIYWGYIGIMERKWKVP